MKPTQHFLKVLVPLASNQGDDNEKSATKAIAYHGYLKKLISRGVMPVLVSHHYTPMMLESLKAEVCGVLLMGGSDVNPTLYSEAPHPKSGPFDNERDNFEAAIITWARSQQIPILGICRGCQLLAVATGGTLHQHVPDLPNALSHSPQGNLPYHEAMSNVTHVVTLAEGSKTKNILGAESVITNSYHHQSVKTLGASFIAGAHTSDGVIEAIEDRTEGYFCFGIQSHPEALEPSFGEKLFDSFVEAVAKYEMGRINL